MQDKQSVARQPDVDPGFYSFTIERVWSTKNQLQFRVFYVEISQDYSEWLIGKIHIEFYFTYSVTFYTYVIIYPLVYSYFCCRENCNYR